MGILDAPLGQVANTLLGTFGRPAVLVRPGSGGEYNPTTLSVEGRGTDLELACSVVFEEFSQSRVDGTLIQQGDRKALVSRVKLQEGTTAPEPVPGSDYLRESGNGRTWQIVSVLGFSTGDSEAAYSLHVRR